MPGEPHGSIRYPLVEEVAHALGKAHQIYIVNMIMVGEWEKVGIAAGIVLRYLL